MDAYDVMTVKGRLNDAAVQSQLDMILTQFPRPWAFDERQNILDCERKLIPPMVVNCANILIEIQCFRKAGSELLPCSRCKRALPRKRFYADKQRGKRGCSYLCDECTKVGVYNWRGKKKA